MRIADSSALDGAKPAACSCAAFAALPQLSLVAITAWSEERTRVSVGFASGLAIPRARAGEGRPGGGGGWGRGWGGPRAGGGGPVPTPATVLWAGPRITNPPIITSLPVSTCMRVEMFARRAEGLASKVAVTALALSMVTVQPPVPVQAPLQPANVEPPAAAAVKVTTVPELKLNAHVAPQSMPPTFEVTVAGWAALLVPGQSPGPWQAPPQPANTELPAATAVRVTTVPTMKLNEQVAPQLMPATFEVTVPVPVPVLVTMRVLTSGANVAVAVFAELMVTWQVPVPTHAPLQPVNTEPAVGTAVKVTTVPTLKLNEHVAPQLIPGTSEVTVPVPLPVLITVSVCVINAKVAVTAFAAFIVTTQVPVPLHPAPLQPVNVEPLFGAAVRVTTVPELKSDAHVAPQLITFPFDVTVPVPLPDFATLREYVTGANVAVTALTWSIVTTHVPVPLHPSPLHPVNTDSAAGVAVSVTAVAWVMLTEQVDPQLIPPTFDVTVPAPLPAFVTVRAKVDNGPISKERVTCAAAR